MRRDRAEQRMTLALGVWLMFVLLLNIGWISVLIWLVVEVISWLRRH